MALIQIMLGTVLVYHQAGEYRLALKELHRALDKARSLRPTRKARIMRAHIAQCIERERACL